MSQRPSTSSAERDAAGPAAGRATASEFSPARFALGLLLLAVAVTASIILVLGHFDAMSMPGCGEGSACAQAAASKWGKIPGIGERGWPVSFLGLAYFLGLFLAWALAKGVVPGLFKWIVRLGALVSLFFVSILFIEGHLCQYCLAAHGANLAFWLMLETAGRATATRLRPVGTMAGAFVAASIGLYVADQQHGASIEARQEELRSESVERIMQEDERKRQIALAAQKQDEANRATESAPTNANAGDANGAENGDSPAGDVSANAAGAGSGAAETTANAETSITIGGIKADVGDRPWKGGFTGRWRLGPEKAAVRIVMLTDYQCPDCKRIEEEVMAFVKETPTVSLSIKHFPMDQLCNAFMNTSLHGNACWAARAAEAAGILYGNDGFWKMHTWLFNHKGSFTNEELQAGVLELGFEPTQFINTMISDETLLNVQGDIEQGHWLGLHYTPMVFINGVELVGVFARNAVVNSAKQVLARNPTPMNADLDQPQPAVAKYISDWREQPVRNMPVDVHPFQRGPDNAKVSVTVWIDYQQDVSPELNGIIRDWMKDKGDVQYNVRHYPFNQECNAAAPRTVYQNSCLAARAAEAAGLLGGADAFWKMHEWLLANQAAVSESAIRQQAASMGLDVNELFTAMNGPAVADAITKDAQAGKTMLYRGTPTVYVNNRAVPRWKKEDAPVLLMILNEAYADAAGN